MPELPDISIYVESLERHLGGACLDSAEVFSPSFLRSVDPPLDALVGQRLVGCQRIGKRIAFEFENGRFMVLHLMITGRLRFKRKAGNPSRRNRRIHAVFRFSSGELTVTEASSKKRASLYIVPDRRSLLEHDPGGIEPLECDLETFTSALVRSNHTLKRALSDPRIFSGIGNAYSDEILHAARLSPVKLTQKLSEEEIGRLFDAVPATLRRFTEALRKEVGDGFPEKVTAFREDMAVHGRYREPCPTCGSAVQRIAYADRETNYCPECQNQGRLLADRALSRLLKKDWPRTLEELEERRGGKSAESSRDSG